MEEKEKEWYSNKELYEMIDKCSKAIIEMKNNTPSLKDLNELKTELYETKRVVKEYNELRGKLDNARKRIDDLEDEAFAKESIFRFIKDWGGWIVASVITILYVIKLIYDLYIMIE